MAHSVEIAGVQVDQGTIPLWTGVVGGPFIWLLQFQINYMMVPWVCTNGNMWIRHLIALLALLLVLAGGWLACIQWRRHGRGGMEEEHPGLIGRTQFLGMLGMLLSVLFALIIVMQDIAIFFISPCWT